MFEFEPVSVEDVRKLLRAEAPPTFHKSTDPFKALRRKEAPVVLEGYALAWLANLPSSIRPRVCAEKYPRIINKLAAIWEVSDISSEYLSELLVDSRGNRKGFAPEISKEIWTLRAHKNADYNSKPNDAWVLEKLTRA